MENEQKTTKIRWEGNKAFVGELYVGILTANTSRYYPYVGGHGGPGTNTEAEARAWVEQYLGVEEEVVGNVEDPKPGIEWINGEGFVDGVFRATVEESAITHTNAGKKREKPLFRAFVIREDGVQSKAANCLDESAAKRWCERMILGEG
jgi:hypothetical protein